jgi:hypothetical protein
MPSKTTKNKKSEEAKEEKPVLKSAAKKPELKKEEEKPAEIRNQEQLKDSGDKLKPKKKKSKKKVIVLSVVFLLVVILGGLVTVGIGVYKFNWDNGFTNSITNTLPYPVAMVNNHLISYSDYQSDVDALKFFYEKQKELYPDQASSWTIEEVRKNVMDRLIEDELASQVAAEKGISVTKDEVNNEFDLIVSQATSREEVEKTILDLYGWTPDEFKDKVLFKFLLRSKLESTIQEDPEIVAAQKTEAEEVLEKIKSGEMTFAEAAAQYSDDATATSGGDLGYFGRGEMVKEFEDAAFGLEIGTVSDIVKTQFGYHIIKVDEKVMQGEGDAAEEVVKASHILVAFPSIDNWLTEEVTKAKVYRLIKT